MNLAPFPPRESTSLVSRLGVPDLGNLETPYITSSVHLCLGGWAHCTQALVSLPSEGNYRTGRSLQKTNHPQKLCQARWLPLAGLGTSVLGKH